MSVSLAVGLVIKFLLRDTPGGIVELHLFRSLDQFSNLGTYFHSELTYGIIGPSGMFVGTLLFIAVVAMRGWPPCNPVIKQHIAIGAAVTLPLVLLFAFPGGAAQLQHSLYRVRNAAGIRARRSRCADHRQFLWRSAICRAERGKNAP